VGRGRGEGIGGRDGGIAPWAQRGIDAPDDGDYLPRQDQRQTKTKTKLFKTNAETELFETT